MVDSVVLTNRALAEIGSRSQITSLTDGSTEALYANLLYGELRDFLLRQGDYDFSMKVVATTAAGVVVPPWEFSYTYPADAIRIRNLLPVGYTDLNPIAVAYNILQFSTKNIVTKVAAAFVIYTYAPTEDTWDAVFTEAFVRMLGSSLAFSLQNRIETSKEKLSEAITFAGIANLRDG